MKSYTNEDVNRLKTNIYNKIKESGKVLRQDSTINNPLLSGNRHKEEILETLLNEEELEFYKIFGDLKRFCGFLQSESNDLKELFCPYCLEEGKYNFKSYRYGETKEFGATCGSRKCRGRASSDTKSKFTPERWHEIDEKRSDFYEKKYGIRYKNCLQIPEVREKGKKTMMSKYGTLHTLTIHKKKEELTNGRIN